MNKSNTYFTSFKSGKAELESLFLFSFLSGMLRIQTDISTRDWTWYTYKQSFSNMRGVGCGALFAGCGRCLQGSER